MLQTFSIILLFYLPNQTQPKIILSLMLKLRLGFNSTHLLKHPQNLVIVDVFYIFQALVVQ